MLTHQYLISTPYNKTKLKKFKCIIIGGWARRIENCSNTLYDNRSKHWIFMIPHTGSSGDEYPRYRSSEGSKEWHTDSSSSSLLLLPYAGKLSGDCLVDLLSAHIHNRWWKTSYPSYRTEWSRLVQNGANEPVDVVKMSWYFIAAAPIQHLQPLIQDQTFHTGQRCLHTGQVSAYRCWLDDWMAIERPIQGRYWTQSNKEVTREW